ncbi:MAG TPA: carbohydrate ABC transporter permease [Firmicutes bacterium]|nr:carbohydrate ABC transporter permease [Bacillota bacterium]
MTKRRLRHSRTILRPARSAAGDAATAGLLLGFGAFMILPLLYAVCSAFKPLDELFLFPPRFFVSRPTLDNFSDLFLLMEQSWVPFSRYIFNTVFITVTATAGNVLISSMAAYMLEKRRFPGSRFLFEMVVTALMFSTLVTAIPNYVIISKLHWLDSYLALIIPAFATPMGLYLMKQFMNIVHDSLIESAKLDGASEWIIFWRIVMPIVRPAWLTLIIFSFQGMWGQTGGSFIYSEELKTLPYALNQVMAGGVARAGVGSAVALLMMLAPIAVFVITQSSIIQTMATSGIKE